MEGRRRSCTPAWNRLPAARRTAGPMRRKSRERLSGMKIPRWWDLLEGRAGKKNVIAATHAHSVKSRPIVCLVRSATSVNVFRRDRPCRIPRRLVLRKHFLQVLNEGYHHHEGGSDDPAREQRLK